MRVDCFDDKITGGCFECPISNIRKQKEEVSNTSIKTETPNGDYFFGKGVYEKMKAMPKFAPKEELKEPDRIEVFAFASYTDCKNGTFAHTYTTNKLFNASKLPAIKQAIERVLNDDGWNFVFKKDAENYLKAKYYTQEQVDKMMEDIAGVAWSAARDKVVLDRNPSNKQYRYLSFDQWYSSIKDYKNSLK
jgi:hypothetical protein